jgi:23S rRNA (guanosine2251-2'-O)-methyltransferase
MAIRIEVKPVLYMGTVKKDRSATKVRSPASQIWLYGFHACRMALENPRRQIFTVLVAGEDILAKVLSTSELKSQYDSRIKKVTRHQLEAVLPPQSVHQGIAVQVSPLSSMDITDLDSDPAINQCVVVLDQISDPHNAGAILRSAAVFGARAVILTQRNAPPESGVLAKSASGALDIVPLIRITNLAEGLRTLKEMGFWCVGLAESGKNHLDHIDLKGKIALIMGAEGEGMRRLTKDLCDFIVSLPSANAFSALNVSNAAAIALYATYQAQNKAFE